MTEVGQVALQSSYLFICTTDSRGMLPMHGIWHILRIDSYVRCLGLYITEIVSGPDNNNKAFLAIETKKGWET